MTLVRLAKEEEGVGLSAGAHFAGVKSAMLMQKPRLSCLHQRQSSPSRIFYKVPLLMLINLSRFVWASVDPWQTQGGNVTEALLRAMKHTLFFSRRARIRGKAHPASPHPCREQSSACCSAPDART